MKIAILALTILLILVASSILYLRHRMANTIDKHNLEAAIDAEVQKTIKNGMHQGIVVGVYKDGTSVIKGYGVVSKGSSQVPNADTVFQIGSVSKVLTALLLQRLCDQGLVSMDSTLAELLGDSVVLAPSVQGVTLRQLVTHTSGFPRIPKPLGDKITKMAGSDEVMLDPYSYLQPGDVFEYLAHAEGKQKPGKFAYSNYGTGLLAQVLEVVTGKDYESLVKEELLLPLGMHHTAINLTPEMSAQLAQGHTAKGLPTRVWTFAALGGAGAFSSTAEDLMTFIRSSLTEGNLAAQLLQKMREPQSPGNTGIGWMQPSFIDRFLDNRNLVWHNGMVGGYASYLAIDKKSGTGVVVLSNQANATEMLGMMLMRQARTQSWSLSAADLVD